MRSTTQNVHSKPPTPSYSPSVPVYVYRELVAELQAVQAKLDVVTSHNQKLSQENQHLRQEINKVVQSCLELQKLVDSSAPSSQPAPPNNANVKNTTSNQSMPRANSEAKNTPASPRTPRTNAEAKSTNKPANKPPVKTAPPPRQPTPKPAKKIRREVVSVPMMDMNFPVSEAVFIEGQEVRYYLSPESESKGLSGWWLLLTIVLIMITGFGAGYLVVRPLLQNQSQNSIQ
ncbi:hypothetical protein H6G06_23915 [Anabaena sphaerica FACHB-251]|uniref:Uncharacterized protein n=2 Tax=Anabaena TaxID=1163 RepID=A0A926WKX5_9NOST|nr:hypothetical protein [Anabaena sphaerica]MBD2296445.1 hypothetical protein [Anabaena sphaerica FACHB-251]